MCGIAGIYLNNSNIDNLSGCIKKMTNSLVHRGPDEEGFYFDGSVALGMRRLSIIDLISGKQPIHNEKSTIYIVYNGEIYNYRELKKTLELRNHKFYTQSDTETIVHAYEEYGADCVGKLRGMFSFALWDSKNQRFFIAVDRFGIKPLYYTINDNYLIFGSEIKSVMASDLVPREIDFDAMTQFFTIGYIPAPYTIFKAIHKLAPACIMSWSPGQEPIITQYWDLSDTHLGPKRKKEELQYQLLDMLKNTVRSHLISDVPLGAFLSGGIDSSTVVALMRDVGTGTVKTFSIGFADSAYDESYYARLMAKHFETEHHELIIEPENADVLPRIVSNFDEPFADASALPTYYVSKMARKNVKVALSGDGGDELFIGYTIFRGLTLSRYMQRLPAFSRKIISMIPHLLPRMRNPSWNDRIARWEKIIMDSLLAPEEAYRSKITKIGLPIINPLLSNDIQQHLFRRDPFIEVDKYLLKYQSENESHALDKFVYTGLKVSLAGDMLIKVDRTSMANSLEVRVPFLDHELAQFIATIPIEQRFPRWRLKGLLKDTMAEMLPTAILNHSKHGFNIPLAAWFRGDLSSFVRDVLLSRQARQSGFWNNDGIELLLKRHVKGSHNFDSAIWSLLIFEIWRRQWFL